jgi:hypothetical protein
MTALAIAQGAISEKNAKNLNLSSLKPSFTENQIF